MDLQNKTVLVIGTGKSGIGAAGLLSKAGAKTILFDSNEKLNVEALKEKTAGISSLQIVTGTLPLELEEQVELHRLGRFPADHVQLGPYCRGALAPAGISRTAQGASCKRDPACR